MAIIWRPSRSARFPGADAGNHNNQQARSRGTARPAHRRRQQARPRAHGHAELRERDRDQGQWGPIVSPLVLARRTREAGGQAWTKRWLHGAPVNLLVALTPWTGAWPQGRTPNAGPRQQQPPERRLSVVVHQGRLSVDVREADAGEVLSQLGQQAGIRMLTAASAGRQISA
jgi:hypothetical protein